MIQEKGEAYKPVRRKSYNTGGNLLRYLKGKSKKWSKNIQALKLMNVKGKTIKEIDQKRKTFSQKRQKSKQINNFWIQATQHSIFGVRGNNF